jgi:hypothetical protein
LKLGDQFAPTLSACVTTIQNACKISTRAAKNPHKSG